MKTFRLTLLLLLLFTPSWLTITATAAPPAQLAAPKTSPTYWEETSPFSAAANQLNGFWVVRAYFEDRSMVNRLASRIEPWEVNHEDGYVVVGVDQNGLDFLLELGFQVEIDERLTQRYLRPPAALPDQTAGIPGFPCYRTVEETYSSMETIVADYPNLASWIDIGDSWDKTEPGGPNGYDLKVLKLTNTAIPGPKPKLFITASIHAREYSPAELTTRFAEYLVENYGRDADVTWILDFQEIHLMPIGNPDGRIHAETGLYWRKNTNQNYCSPVSTARGADMNRNFDFYWGCCGGSSVAECDEVYRGPSPASEPETQAIQSYLVAEFPDQRGPGLSDLAPPTATGVYLDIHSYGELVIWPWGFSAAPAPNGAALQTFGRRLAYFNGYKPDQAIGLYPVDGAADDYGYGELGIAALSFELGNTFFETCAAFETVILPNNLPALLYSAKAARTPYLTPSGPEVRGIEATPSGPSSGEPIELVAVIDDKRFNNSNGIEPTQTIVAAEYYLDTPPWSSSPAPVAHSMNAADGSFNNTSESVIATIDTTTLTRGRHILYLRGMDSSGIWGPVSAHFIYIFDPAIDPTIQGFIRNISDYSPLAATVSASGPPGDFFAASDPITGQYMMQVYSDTYKLSAGAPDFLTSVISNVQTQNYQTTYMDLYLTPICTLAEDDVESGNLGWQYDSPWQISTEAYHSPNHAWTDSPIGAYGDKINIALTSANLDLSPYNDIALEFWHIYGFEAGYDFGFVEFSIDGGLTWETVKTFTGSKATWQQETVQLPAADNQPTVKLRFRITSDPYITEDGWHIDDIRLSGVGCVPLYQQRIFLPYIQTP